MSQEMQIFQNAEFGSVRTVEINGEPWVVGKDVAQALGYRNPQEAIRAHVDDDDKGVSEILTPGGKQSVPIINESGLYSLCLSSKLPTAKKFRRWVTSEVLPSIRKHGAYMTPETLEAAILNPDYLLKVATALKAETDKRKALEAKIAADAPKVLFSEAVTASDSCILIGDFAKVLRQNGVDIGQNRLFQWLRDNGYLIRRKGDSWNMPTQKAIEKGLFFVKETVIHDGENIRVRKTVKLTGDGQVYFLNKFKGTMAE